MPHTTRPLLLLFFGLFLCVPTPTRAGQAGPFPQLYGRPTLFCPPGNYAKGLTARIEADALLLLNNDNQTELDAVIISSGGDEALLYVHCVPCPIHTFSDGSDAWGLEECHPCPEGALMAGSTACV